MRASLSFPFTTGHYGNGMEFINKPFLEQRLVRHIQAIRSRPCRKNDNCFVKTEELRVVIYKV
jgi:hypothetical protein